LRDFVATCVAVLLCDPGHLVTLKRMFVLDKRRAEGFQ
jgi:hypothetical protein